MVDQRAAIGIVQQVDELVLDIAIVHVERRHACLVRSNHAFEVFIAVVEVETQMILPRLEALQRGTFLLAAKRVCPQHIGKTARALRKLPPGDAAIAKDDAFAVRCRRRNRFADLGKIELHERLGSLVWVLAGWRCATPQAMNANRGELASPTGGLRRSTLETAKRSSRSALFRAAVTVQHRRVAACN